MSTPVVSEEMRWVVRERKEKIEMTHRDVY
jgi:hypothetical protein